MRYLKCVILSTALILSACPGDECKTDSDCGDGEQCVSVTWPKGYEDRPARVCADRPPKEGDSAGGWRVKKVGVSAGPLSVEVERE